MNWFGFGVAFLLIAVVPVWVIKLFPMGFGTKLLLTLFLGAVTYFAVQSGGWKRGMISK